MVFSDIRDRVYYRLGRTQEASAGTLNTEILDAVNCILRETMNTLNIDELRDTSTITTVAGTQEYNLATDFSKMIIMWESNSYQRELIRISPEEYKLYLSDVDTTRGEIYYYDILDNTSSGGAYLSKVSLFPVPGSAATVPYQYQKKLSDITSDTDENILLERYPDLFIEGASYILYRDNIYRDNPERIAFRRGEYARQVELLQRAQRRVSRIDKVSPKRIIGTPKSLYTTQYTGYTS